MKINIFTIVTILILACACKQESTDTADNKNIVAKLNDKTISESELRNELLSLPGGERKASRIGAYQNTLSRMINSFIAEQEAVSQKVHEDQQFINELELIKMRAKREERELMQKFLLSKIKSETKLSEEELQSYYEENKHRFLSNKLHMRRITVKEKKLADEIYKKLKSGSNFAELAKKENIDPTLSAQKGDMGPLLRNEIPRDLRAAAFSLKNKNEISLPFATKDTWTILQLLEKEERVVRSFSNVREQLAQELQNKKSTEKMQLLLKKRKESSTVKIDKAALAKLGPLIPERKQTVQINLEKNNSKIIRSGH